MIVHDTDEGFFAGSAAQNTGFYGNIVYNNGWIGPDRGHGHGFYVQNQSPSQKTLQDNIIFQQFGEGIQCYGSPNAYIQNFVFDGNTIFDNGSLTGQGDDYNILIAGGNNWPQNMTVTNNYTYHTPSWGTGLSSLSWGFDSGASNLTATNNYFIGGNPAIDINAWTGATFTNNTIYGPAQYAITASQLHPTTYTWNNNAYYDPTSLFAELNGQDQPFSAWQTAAGVDANSTYTHGAPKGTWVFVRPSQHETGRANVTIYNWPLSSSVSVDLSSVLTPGKQFVIQNAQDFFAAPVVSGTYTGGLISIPMTNLTAAQPIGSVPNPPQPVGPLFGAFVVLQP
jgi:hypothetical protein